MARRLFRPGDSVEVRSAAEILATLDEGGRFDGMPFMPEMMSYIGQRLRVYRVAEKVCDTINLNHTSRRPMNAVFLESVRCDGSGHDGCQAECRIFWKTAWLRPVDELSDQRGSREGSVASNDDPSATRELARLVAANADDGGAGGARRFSCQATQLVEASHLLKVYDPRPYVRELTAGNVRLGRWIKVMGRAAVMQPAWAMGRLKNPVLAGTTAATPATEPLDLLPGEWVRVRSPEEIETTLNDKGRNRGLWFDREFLPYCGRVFRVRGRVTQIINETDGRMLDLANDCIVLEEVECSGDHSVGRWFCPREIPCYWRECWLERAEPPTA